MIAKLAKSTAHFFYKKNIVKQEDEEVYAYGMELLYSSIFNIFLAVLISVATNTFLPTTVFAFAFAILRQYIGGYHAKTHFGCMSILTVVLIIFSILSKNIPINFEIPISSVVTVISIILVILFAPVENSNKPLSDNDKIRLRKNGILCIFIISIIIMVMDIFAATRRYGMYISMGIFVSSIAMLCEILRERKNCLKNEN